MSAAEALEWLTAQATATWGTDAVAGMAEELQGMAEAMAVVSAVPIADDIEPLFI